jgi:integrase/recombinase XerC
MNELRVINNNVVMNVSFSNEMFTRWTSFIDATPKTIETYTKAVRQFLYYLQANGIKQPTRADVIAFKDFVAKEHKPTTAQNYLMAVKQFFKWTNQEGIYPNIADNVKAVKLTKGHKKDYLTTAQVKNVLSTADNETIKGLRDYAILSLMVTTGLRTVEVVRANIEDMRTVADFTALFIQGKGRTEKTEFVKLSQKVEDAIRAYLKARGTAKGNEPLFSSLSNRNNNERMTTRSVSRIAKTHFIDAGLNSDRITAHSLRHTTATLNLLNGGTVEETQQLLRHSNINTTLIYSHALERANNNSEQRVTDAIFND